MKMNRYGMEKNDENIPRRGCNYGYRPSKIKENKAYWERESYLLMEHLIESNWKVPFCSIGSFFIDLLYREHIYMLMCSYNNAVCNITFIRKIFLILTGDHQSLLLYTETFHEKKNMKREKRRTKHKNFIMNKSVRISNKEIFKNFSPHCALGGVWELRQVAISSSP